jgi:hypothetical protein
MKQIERHDRFWGTLLNKIENSYENDAENDDADQSLVESMAGVGSPLVRIKQQQQRR